MARKDVPDALVVQAAAKHHTVGGAFVDELLSDWTGEPVKVCRSAIARTLARGLVECGVSERTCWPAGWLFEHPKIITLCA